MLAAVALALVASLLLKDLFTRARPQPPLALVYARGWTMPSTDAAITAAATAALVAAGRWSGRLKSVWVSAVATVFCIVVGGSVIYLGAHWLSDVLVGWLLGAAIGIAAARWATAARPLLPGSTRGHHRTGDGPKHAGCVRAADSP